jgi:hypothetical protein
MKYSHIYNTNIKVGDIVTGYFPGYWKVVKIEPRYPYTADGNTTVYVPYPIIYGSLIAGANRHTKEIESWDISYSQKLDPDRLAVILAGFKY